jgi:hypothetical protein
VRPTHSGRRCSKGLLTTAFDFIRLVALPEVRAGVADFAGAVLHIISRRARPRAEGDGYTYDLNDVIGERS